MVGQPWTEVCGWSGSGLGDPKVIGTPFPAAVETGLVVSLKQCQRPSESSPVSHI